MKENKQNQSRRTFLTRTIPACALACAIQPAMPLLASKGETPLFGEHKFDGPFPGKMTHRMYFELMYGQMAQTTKAFMEKYGEKEVLDFIKERTEKRMTSFGKSEAQRHGDKVSFEKYVEKFRGGYENALTKEVVKDTDTVFELKVTECIWHEAFKRFGAQEIGAAEVCHGDYAWARGYSPHLRMERTKTLMEGHDCCNHCYIWDESR